MTKKINDNLQVLGEVSATKVKVGGSIPLYRSASSLVVGETVNLNDIFYIEKTDNSNSTNEGLYRAVFATRTNDGNIDNLVGRCFKLDPQLSTWAATNKYTVSDVVIYLGDVYRCLTSGATIGNTPIVDAAHWEKILTGASAMPVNTPATISTFVAGEGITEGDFLAIHTDGKAYKLSLTYTKYIGVANNSVAVSGNVDVVTEGTTSKLSGLTIGEKYYYNLAGESYTTRQVIPSTILEHSSTAANGKIYIFGGTSSSGIVNTTYEYDPVANTWATKAVMPVSLYSHSSSEYNGKIYIFGGYNTGYAQVNTNYEYDPVADTWATKAVIPIGLADHSSSTLNGKIYIFGGKSSSGKVNTTYEYDPVADTWATKAVMPVSLHSHSSSTLNGKIYIFGGLNTGYAQVNTNYEYDPVADTWATKAVIPIGLADHSSSTLNGKIYIFGGVSSSGIVNTTYEYDPVANTWATKAVMPVSLYLHSSSTYNGKIYIIGGYVTGIVNTNYEYFLGGSYLNTTTSDNLVGLATSATSLILNNPKLSIGGESGTYTPVVTAVANVSATSVLGTTAIYNRVGKVVTVTGNISVTPTASSTSTKVYITLPISRTFTTAYGQIGGIISSLNLSGSTGGFLAQTDMTKGTISFISTSTSATNFSYSFSYILE